MVGLNHTACQSPIERVQDHRAWLTLYDIGIDYPVFQDADNTYYKNHDMYGDSAIGGSIFLDAKNSGDFSDNYNVIYGYSKKSDALFGDLWNFQNETYYNSHKNGILITSSSGVYDLTTVAIAQTDVEEPQIYAADQWSDVYDFLETGDDNGTSIGTTGLFFDTNDIDPTDKVVALSTTESNNSESRARIVAFVKMERRSLLRI